MERGRGTRGIEGVEQGDAIGANRLSEGVMFGLVFGEAIILQPCAIAREPLRRHLFVSASPVHTHEECATSIKSGHGPTI